MAELTETAGAVPEQAPELWERLLAGRVTEVFTFSGRGLVFDLPQTLGLEPLGYDAYRYDRAGVPRDPDELDRIARELSAQQRWICNAGPLFWARHFAAAAQAVLVFPSTGSERDSRIAGAAARVDAGVSRAVRALRGRRDRRRAGDEAAESDAGQPAFVRLEELDPPGPTPSYQSRLVNFLLSEFPEKTFRLSAEDAKALQTVRALPPGR